MQALSRCALPTWRLMTLARVANKKCFDRQQHARAFVLLGTEQFLRVPRFAHRNRALQHNERFRRSAMIRKLKSGEYRLYSRKINPKTGRRRNLGTFKTRAAAQKHERAVQYFKRSG
jgi:hypothetical protein